MSRIAIIGSGNWGSTIATVIGKNVTLYPDRFHPIVNMWVKEEIVDDRRLTDIINIEHENVKYLPGKKLPKNIVAVPDIIESALGVDILVIVLPHQFISSCNSLRGNLKPGAKGISLIKGFDTVPGGGIKLISDSLREILDIPISVLMGANIAHEVADEMFCETTIGCLELGKTAEDVTTVELCGALKNIVACGAGFVDGMKLGDNTKAAVIRLGLMEMIRFAEVFFSNKKSSLSTFFESCGVADLITTCYGGRNRKVAEAYVNSTKTFADLEKGMLNGQKLQGPETAAEVNFMLKMKNMENQFPLFSSVHSICTGKRTVYQFIDDLRSHPEHMIKADAHL